jgi:hypothetical protein
MGKKDIARALKHVTATSEFRSLQSTPEKIKMMISSCEEATNADVARQLKCHPSTVSKARNRSTKRDGSHKCGQPHYLHHKDEQTLVAHIIAKQQAHNSLSMSDVAAKAMELRMARDQVLYLDPPGERWAKRFCDGHPELGTKTGEWMEDIRHSATTTESIEKFFDKATSNVNPARYSSYSDFFPLPSLPICHLSITVSINFFNICLWGCVAVVGCMAICVGFYVLLVCSYDPRLTFNVDETFLTIKDTKMTVAVQRDSRSATRVSAGLPGYHMTLINVCCARQDPYRMSIPTPTLIIPGKRVPADDGEEDQQLMWNWCGSETGWINHELWVQWLQVVFIPWVERHRKAFSDLKSERVLLWSDGHQSRLQLPALTMLQDAKIDLVLIPPHTSHILQPLDCGIHNKFKVRLRQIFYDETARNNIEHSLSRPEYRALILECATSALHSALEPMRVKRAWATTGLSPWKPHAVLDNSRKVHDSNEPGKCKEDNNSDVSSSEEDVKVEGLEGTILTPEKIVLRRQQRMQSREQKKEIKLESKRIKEEEKRVKQEEKHRVKEEEKKVKQEEKRVKQEEKQAKATAEKEAKQALKRKNIDEKQELKRTAKRAHTILVSPTD